MKFFTPKQLLKVWMAIIMFPNTKPLRDWNFLQPYLKPSNPPSVIKLYSRYLHGNLKVLMTRILVINPMPKPNSVKPTYIPMLPIIAKNTLMLFSPITSLYKPVSPTAVRPRIITVSVNAVNRGVLFSVLFYMSFVRMVHISFKLLKRLPLVLYSSATIVLKRLMVRLVTPAKNLSINIVESIAKHPVFRGGFTQSVFSSTTTRSGVSVFKIVSNYINRITAIATTMPQRVLSLYTSKPLDQELPKLQTCQYFYSTHIDTIAKLREWVKQDCGDKHYQLINYIYG